jgi:hypothetical protein
MVPGAQVSFRYVPMVESSAAKTLMNAVSVSGGGMAEATNSEQAMTVGLPEPFGVKTFDMSLLDASGDPTSQSGSAPQEAGSTMRFRTFASSIAFLSQTAPVERLKDTTVHVPAGFVGNPLVTPVRCTSTQLTESSPESGGERIPNCPQDSQIGIAHLVTAAPGLGPSIVPLYNMVPRPGVPAEFGFSYFAITVTIAAKLRPQDDGIDLVATKSPSSIGIAEVDVTLWGVPADNSHDRQRHLCLEGYHGNDEGRSCPSSAPRKPFLRTPTSCTGAPLPWSTEITTYTHPDTPVKAETTSPTMTGCELLPFAPSFAVTPSELVPHVPTGLDATLSMPQENGPDGLAEADLRSATVTLPEGVSVNPSSADGLQACNDEQLKLGVEGVASCPEASKIGTLTVTSPALAHAVGGSIFLRPQLSDDPASGEMFRVALEIRSDEDGVDVKLPAQIKLDPATGRLTTVIRESPQLPVSSVALHFKDGPRAPLTTPRGCGTYTTTGTFTSWSGRTVSTNSQFSISGDGHGAPCTNAPFAPTLKAGTISNRAGASSPFVLSLTRTDSDQPLSTLSSLTLPPGLTGDIASISVRCSDAQVAAHACPEASRIGNVTTGAGAGPDPFYITNGNAYLTGPYKGAPFGLAFIVHAQAGPFDLGYVVVRAAIQIDPHTAQAIVRTDPLPTILDGVPLQLRDIRVSVDRPGFMLNPTNCQPMQITGTATSTEGATANLSSRFQAADCASLGFHPAFTASTQGKTSRREGASLTVKVAFKAGQANIAKVKVSLPKALPSRLDTLKLACRDAVFDANPAACPAASRVGAAVAKTPILTSALTGPAYIVSHGGAAFPDLEMVLQGEGVTLILDGKTDIKNNVTTSTFDTVPDVPVSNFELRLPEGVHSVLGAPGGNLCGKALAMPTTLTGQNGAVLRRSTHVVVSGCRPAIRVVGHSVRGAHARIRVAVPAAGTLVASGGDVGRAVKRVARAGTATIAVTLSGHDRHVLARNPRQRVNAVVRLRFKPRRGAPLSAQVRLLLG